MVEHLPSISETLSTIPVLEKRLMSRGHLGNFQIIRETRNNEDTKSDTLQPVLVPGMLCYGCGQSGLQKLLDILPGNLTSHLC